jgi:hypothetical protein
VDGLDRGTPAVGRESGEAPAGSRSTSSGNRLFRTAGRRIMNMEDVFFRSTRVVKYLLPVLLVMNACVFPATGERRVDIVLRNKTERPIELRAQAGLFSRTLLLAPGEVWRGWIFGQLLGSEIRVEVSEDKQAKE